MLELLTARWFADLLFCMFALAWLALCYYKLYPYLYYSDSEKRAHQLQLFLWQADPAGGGVSVIGYYLMAAFLLFILAMLPSVLDIAILTVSYGTFSNTDMKEYFDEFGLANFKNWDLSTKIASAVSVVVGFLTRRILLGVLKWALIIGFLAFVGSHFFAAA